MDKLDRMKQKRESLVQELEKQEENSQLDHQHPAHVGAVRHAVDLTEDSNPSSDYKKHFRYADHTPYYERYSLEPRYYAEYQIELLDFSFRLEKRLRENGYDTVQKLLKANDTVLRAIRGFGTGCFEELHAYFQSLKEDATLKVSGKRKASRLTKELLPYRDLIASGDFRFAEKRDDLSLNKQSLHILEQYRNAFDLIDPELAKSCIDRSPDAIRIVETLGRYVRKTENRKKCEHLLKSLPQERLEISASRMMNAFTDNPSALRYLEGSDLDDTLSLKEYLLLKADKIDESEWMKNFVNWCSFDVNADIQYFFTEVLVNERSHRVIRERSEGKTLELIGASEGVTRERVRQIEKKAHERFFNWQKKQRIAYKLFISMNETSALSSAEILQFVEQFAEEFLYLLKQCDQDELYYDLNLDLFLLGDPSLSDRARSYVDCLPQAFHERTLEEYLQTAKEKQHLPVKVVSAVIERNYMKTGDTYHRFILNLSSIYSDIMQRFYPNGFHIYDDQEIAKFKKLVHNEYDIDISDKSYRSIVGILSRVGILCGRGIYKVSRDKEYISEELAERIYQYIEESPHPIFMTNTLFSVFEEELLAEGVDNKYYLQGILKELYGKEWVFSRDYISKDASYTSIYSSIVDFIQKSPEPVSKEKLYEYFPGVTEIVFNLATNDPDILYLHGQYLHSSRLKLSESDKQYLRKTIDDFLRDKDVCHSRDIFEYLRKNRPTILKENYIQFSFSLYSLLEHLFRDHYHFSRPFVAKQDASYQRGEEIMRSIVAGSDRIQISKLRDYAREHHFQLEGLQELIDSCNQTHLQISRSELLSIEKTGVTEEIARELEALILSLIDGVDGAVPIDQLPDCAGRSNLSSKSDSAGQIDLASKSDLAGQLDLSSLSEIEVDWNEWLVYSVLKKWATRIETGVVTDPQGSLHPEVSRVVKGSCQGDGSLDNLGCVRGTGPSTT